MIISLETSHEDFNSLHEAAANGRGKFARIMKDQLTRLLIDHSNMFKRLQELGQRPTELP